LVGGDAKYIVDLLNNINLNNYEIVFYTDENKYFKQKFAQILINSISVKYISTRPYLFKKFIYSKWYNKHFSSDELNSSNNNIIFKILNKEIRERKIIEYIQWLFSELRMLLQIFWIYDFIFNFFVFRKIFINHINTKTIFHFNNGGYPAKESGLAAIIAAHFYGIKKIVMTIHSSPRMRRPTLFISDRFYDRLISKYCDVIISASEYGKGLMVKERFFPNDKIITIHCGISDKVINSDQKLSSIYNKIGSVKKDAITILAVGHLDWKGKGWDVLIPSIAEVKNEFPNIILFVAAGGSKSAFKKYKELAINNGLENDIKFLGFQPDVSIFYDLCDFFIAPYTGPEATPYTIKEAMRASKPVITTNTGGCPEAVINDLTGLIVEKNSIEELSGAINNLILNKQLRKKMGKEGRKLFQSKFLLSDKVIEHESLYKSLI